MKFEVVATGLGFAEGPIGMADGSILFVDIRAGTLGRVSPRCTVEIIANLGGGPNGAAIGPDGAVYVCNNGGLSWHDIGGGVTIPGHASPDCQNGSIQRVDVASGAVTTLYTQCDGRPLRSPNDIVFDAQGGFWFSDLGKSNEWSTDRGALYYARVDGSKIVCARSGLISPNGVGLSPDQTILYVAETYTGRLWAYDIVGPGILAPPPAPWLSGRLLATLPGYQMLDSLAVESCGNICVAGGPGGRITVFDPSGSHSHYPLAGEIVVTNICFGGSDMCDAWVTASGTGRLYKARWPRPGMKLNFSA